MKFSIRGFVRDSSGVGFANLWICDPIYVGFGETRVFFLLHIRIKANLDANSPQCANQSDFGYDSSLSRTANPSESDSFDSPFCLMIRGSPC